MSNILIEFFPRDFQELCMSALRYEISNTRQLTQGTRNCIDINLHLFSIDDLKRMKGDLTFKKCNLNGELLLDYINREINKRIGVSEKINIENNSIECTNCKNINKLKKKKYEKGDIVCYCKRCGHPVWF